MIQPIVIESKIHEIRGQKVMIDVDLAELYGSETKRLKEAVRRNLTRFPPDFMFQLSAEEYSALRTQIASLEKIGRGKYSKYPPFAFTEHGVTMLASILNSPKAIEMNIAIVRAFIALRQFALNYKDLADQIKQVMQKQANVDGQLDKIYEALENLLDNQTDQQIQKELWKNRPRIGFRKKE